MKTLSQLLYASLPAALLIANGCQATYSKGPVGEPVSLSEVQTAQLNGPWFGDSGIHHIKVIDAEAGKLLVAHIVEDNDAKDLKMEKQVLLFRSIGNEDIGLFNIAPENDQKDEFIVLAGRMETNDILSRIVIWDSKWDAFAKAIEEDRIKGEVRRNAEGKLERVLVDGSDPNLVKLLAGHGIYEYFDMTRPLIMRGLHGNIGERR